MTLNLSKHLVLSFLIFSAADVSADKTPSKKDMMAAKADLETGDVFFEDGLYLEAAKAYDRGFHRSKKPGFVFNAAQAKRLAGLCKEAMDAYNLYLKLEPATNKRNEISHHLEDLSNCIQTSNTKAPFPKSTSPKNSPPPTIRSELASNEDAPLHDRASRSIHSKQWAGVALATAGVVSLGVGGYYGFVGQSRESELEMSMQAQPYETWESGQAANRNMLIFMSIGSLALASGVGLYLWSDSSVDDKQTVAIGVAPTHEGGSVTLTGRY